MCKAGTCTRQPPHCSDFEKLNVVAVFNPKIVIMHCHTLQISGAPAIQLYHDAGYLEDLTNLFVIIPRVNKSLSSFVSTDNLSAYGGTEYPLPSSG